MHWNESRFITPTIEVFYIKIKALEMSHGFFEVIFLISYQCFAHFWKMLAIFRPKADQRWRAAPKTLRKNQYIFCIDDQW